MYFEKLLEHPTIRPVHSTNLIGSVKPEIGTTWGDIDAFVEIIRGFGGFLSKSHQIQQNPGLRRKKHNGCKENIKIPKGKSYFLFLEAIPPTSKNSPELVRHPIGLNVFLLERSMSLFLGKNKSGRFPCV